MEDNIILEKFDFEAEESIIESSDITIDSFENAYVLPMDLSIEMITNWHNSSKLVLTPSFQRRIVWEKNRISQFIESLILNIPIPSILLANDEKNNKFLVIDGKQRLNAIISFISPDKEGKGIKLSNLKVLKDIEGYTFDKLKNDPSKEMYLNKIENYLLKANVLKKHDTKLLYFIFSRLNSGSVPLSTQELRQSLFPGSFTNFINKYSSTSIGIRRVLKLKTPDKRMRDAELLVRYYSFKYFYKDYNGSINEFFNNTCEILNKEWENRKEKINKDVVELELAIDFIYKHFGEDSFKVYFVEEEKEFFGPFNRPMFDLMSSIFSDKVNRDEVQRKNIDLKAFTIALFKTNRNFADAFLPTTHTKEKTKARYDEFINALKNV